jgi:hypothetical protein
MLEQTSPAATVFSRDGAEWVGRLLTGEASLAFPELGIEVPLAEVFDGIAFDDEAAPPAGA